MKYQLELDADMTLQKYGKCVVSSKTGKKKNHLERWAQIIEWRLDQKLKLEDIAIQLGVSQERVRQIITDISTSLGIEFLRTRKQIEKTVTHCATCKIEIVRLSKFFKGEGRHYCSMHMGEWNRKYATSKISRLAQQNRTINRYHSEPDFKRRRLEAIMKYHNRMKTNPEYVAKRLAYSKQYRKLQREKISS